MGQLQYRKTFIFDFSLTQSTRFSIETLLFSIEFFKEKMQINNQTINKKKYKYKISIVNS